jgi:hypothetical protein
MNDAGYYDGWTEHTVVVTPSFNGLNLRISGSNRNQFKDYAYDCFDQALSQDISYELYRESFPELAVTSKWENEDGSPSQCYQAWYSSGVRFWNNFHAAKDHAGKLMEDKWMRHP